MSASVDRTASQPQRAGLVLTALILVAAVANLNLAVANVALPSIGEHFDSSQTALDLIAVGYSLGLACSVLWLGALGDRYGRKMMLLVGTVLAIPASMLAAWAPSDVVLIVARIGGGIAAGMAYPTTLALITALWSGPGRTKAIALWSGIGGAIAALGPLSSGLLARAFLVGLRVPPDPSARGRGDRDGYTPRARSRERRDRAGRQPRRNPLARARRRADPLDQLRAGAGQGHAEHRARARRGRRARAFLPPSATSFEPALRPRRGRTAAVLGGRVRGDHRLRLADGGDVRWPAVLAERSRLLDPGRRPRHPARRVLHGARRPALGEDRRSPWRPLHAPLRLRLRHARLPHDAPPLEGGRLVLESRSRLRPRRDRGRPRRHPGFTLPHRVRARPAGGDGIGNGGPPARPGRRRHAVDLRRAPHSRLCLRLREPDRRVEQAGVRQRRRPADEVVRRRRGDRPGISAVLEPDHGGREDLVRPGRPVGLPGRNRRGSPRCRRRRPVLPPLRAGAGAPRRLSGRGQAVRPTRTPVPPGPRARARLDDRGARTRGARVPRAALADRGDARRFSSRSRSSCGSRCRTAPRSGRSGWSRRSRSDWCSSFWRRIPPA